MKQTLLQLTQDILSSMDADEVTSISDTIESEQVATIIKQVYYDIVHSQPIAEHKGFFTLTATSVGTPTVLTRPSDVMELEWFKYNTRISTDTTDTWEYVHYLSPDEFLDYVQGFDQTQTYVDSFTLTEDSYSTTIYIENDRAPKFWTSFNDEEIVCDAYDSVVDTTGLTAVKTQCFGRLLPSWTHADGATPDLDAEQFRLLYNEAKALAWAEMKQTVHAKAEKKVREQKIHLTRKQQDLPGKDSTWNRSLPNYGRK